MYILIMLFAYNIFAGHTCFSSASEQQPLAKIIRIICINKQQTQKYLDLTLKEATERSEIYRTMDLLTYERIALRYFTTSGIQAISACYTAHPTHREEPDATTPIELDPRYAAMYWEAFDQAAKENQSKPLSKKR